MNVLRLPHPHIAERVAQIFEHAVLERLHPPIPATTDPAAIERWAEWLTPDQWMAEHGRNEDNR